MNRLKIIQDNSAVGLGATVMRVLHSLYYLAPEDVVYYEMKNILYTNTGNTWNKFFLQPFNHVKEEIKNNFNSGNYDVTQNWMGNNKFFLSYGADQRKDQFNDQKLVQLIRDVFNKFINIKPEIIQEAEEYFNAFLKTNKVLSVHCRGTDMFHSHAHGQKHLMDYASVIKPQVEQKLLKENYNKIFLATDEEDILLKFQNDFDDKIIKRKTSLARKGSQAGLHFSHMHSDEKTKNMLGIDMLIDAILMSKCEFSILMKSNVSLLSVFMRSNYNYSFLDDHIDYGRAG